MSRTAIQNRTQTHRNKQSWETTRNGKPTKREIERDVLQSVRQFGSEVSRSVKQRAANLRESASNLRETASDCVTRGRKKVRSLNRSMERRVEQRPLTSLMTAACLGLVVGLIFGRRR